MSDVETKRILEALKRGDTKNAREVLENIGDGVYKGILGAMINSMETKEVNSLVFKILNDEMLKKDVEDLRRNFRIKSTQKFRFSEEREFFKAWYDILSIFLERKKVGLEEYEKKS